MAQVTETLAREFRSWIDRGRHAPMTVSEEQQLVYAWFCLNLLRKLVNEDGEDRVAIHYLEDPEAMAAAVREQYRENDAKG